MKWSANQNTYNVMFACVVCFLFWNVTPLQIQERNLRERNYSKNWFATEWFDTSWGENTTFLDKQVRSSLRLLFPVFSLCFAFSRSMSPNPPSHNVKLPVCCGSAIWIIRSSSSDNNRRLLTYPWDLCINIPLRLKWNYIDRKDSQQCFFIFSVMFSCYQLALLDKKISKRIFHCACFSLVAMNRVSVRVKTRANPTTTTTTGSRRGGMENFRVCGWTKSQLRLWVFPARLNLSDDNSEDFDVYRTIEQLDPLLPTPCNIRQTPRPEGGN